MIIYLLMFLVPVLFLMSPVTTDDKVQKITFVLIGVCLILLIGLRHEVGGDWFRYLDTSYGIRKGEDFDFSIIIKGDIGYRLVHWLSVNYLNGIYSTNSICALFFVIGLIRFCRTMPIPWLALLVSIPFLVIVVSMGYTRQAAALGFLMLGLVDLTNGKKFSFFLFVIIGSLFHFTVLIMAPIGYMYANQKKLKFSHFFATFLLIIFFYIVFNDQISNMFFYYVLLKFHHSDGGFIRVLVGSISAIIFFIYREKFRIKYHDYRLWAIFSFTNILLVPLSISYSTLADRFAVYLIPLQLVVISRIPTLIKSRLYQTTFILASIFFYAALMFAWLIFGNHSNKWLPYQNFLTI